jgi:hypothetical protein
MEMVVAIVEAAATVLAPTVVAKAATALVPRTQSVSDVETRAIYDPSAERRR